VPVARIDDRSLAAPLSGCLRGLTHDGAWVDAGAKVVEIDPRDDPSLVFGLGERPARIAHGVLRAIGQRSFNAGPTRR
jgi:xanthine dehydrogenase accessory factor